MPLSRRAFLALASAAALHGRPAPAESRGLIGLSLPDEASPRWASDGRSLATGLAALGFDCDLKFARNDPAAQVSHLKQMVTAGALALIITPIDSAALAVVLANARAAGIVVVAYDRLIRGLSTLDYYVAFDEFQVGVLQARALLSGLASRFPASRPWSVELFAGSADDAEAAQIFDGAMSLLAPQIAAGALSVPSGQRDFPTCATLRWDTALARARLDKLMLAGPDLHGILSPDDSLSLTLIAALETRGYGSDARPLPIVTGQGCDLRAVRAIIAGTQYSSLFRDRRTLAAATVALVDAALSGRPPDLSAGRKVDNGAVMVPARLLAPVAVDAKNWKQALVLTGAYTEDQLKPVAP